MLADYVYCGNCGRKMYVSIGAEHCPFCKEYGVLQFVNQCEPDVELQHLMRNVMAVTSIDFGDSSCDIVGNSEEENMATANEEIELEYAKHYSTEEFYYEEVL